MYFHKLMQYDLLTIFKHQPPPEIPNLISTILRQREYLSTTKTP